MDRSRIAAVWLALVYGTVSVLSARWVYMIVKERKQEPSIYNLGGLLLCAGVGIASLTCALASAWVAFVREASKAPPSCWQAKATTLGIWVGGVILGVGLTLICWVIAR